MKRRLYQSALALTVLATPITSVVYAADQNSTISSQVSITVDDKSLTYDQQPFIQDNRVFVELRPILEALGATVSWDNASQTATATKGSSSIQVQVGSYFAQKDGMSVQLDEKPQIINSRIMVPARFVSEALGAVVRWHPESNTVAIYTNASSADSNSNTSESNIFSPTGITGKTGVASTTVSDGSVSTTVYSNQNANNNTINLNSLSYQDAVNMALNSSYTLKNALQNIEISNQSLKQASQNVDYIPSSGGNSAATNAFVSYAQAQLGVQISQKTADLTQDSVQYAVKQAYNGLIAAIQNDKFNQLALQNADTQKQLKLAQFQNGLASQLDVDTANSAFTAAQQTLLQGQQALVSAYQAFNKLVGLPIDAKPQLSDVPQMQKLDSSVDLDTKVSQVLAESPNIYSAEQQVNIANLQVQLYQFNNKSASNTYQGTQMGVTVAENTVQSLKDSLEQTVRSQYYSIKQNETQYDALQAQINLDQQNLQAVQAKYDAGMAIKADLVAAQYTLEKDKNALFNQTIQHDNSLMAFDKPWVASGGGTSSGSSSSSKGKSN